MSLLSQVHESFENKLTHYFSDKSWRIKMVLWAVIICLLSFITNITPLFHFKPYFTALLQHHEYFAYAEIKNRSLDWQRNWIYAPFSGLNNRTFRLAMPFFVKIFHLYPASIFLYFFQLIGGVTFFYLLSGYLNKFFEDKISTFYCLMGIATIYVGSSFFIDFSGYCDFYSYFFLFLALYLKNPIGIFAFIQLACWNDERAIAGSGLVLICKFLMPQLEKNKDFKFQINTQMLAIVCSWIVYFSARYYIANYIGLHDTLTKANAGESDFREQLYEDFSGNIIAIGFKFLWSIEGFWIPILLMFFILNYKKDYWRIFYIGLPFLLMLLLSMTIYDTTRSSSFSYPIIFLAILVLKNNLTVKELRFVFFITALFCILHPLATKTKALGMFIM